MTRPVRRISDKISRSQGAIAGNPIMASIMTRAIPMGRLGLDGDLVAI